MNPTLISKSLECLQTVVYVVIYRGMAKAPKRVREKAVRTDELVKTVGTAVEEKEGKLFASAISTMQHCSKLKLIPNCLGVEISRDASRVCAAVQQY